MPLDWKKLKHARGPATRVPQTIKKLAGRDITKAEEAFGVLRDVLVGDGEWFDAAAPSVELLVQSLPKAKHVDLLLVLLAEMLGADHLRAWLNEDEGPPEQVRRAAEDAADGLLAFADAADASLRATAPMLWCTLPAIRDPARAAAQRLIDDADSVVRASAILALARLGGGDEAVEAGRKDDAPLVRGAATIAQLRMGSAGSLTDLRDRIDEWLGVALPTWKEGRTQFPWFGAAWAGWYAKNQFLSAPAQGLAAVVCRLGQGHALVDLALDLGERGSGGRSQARAGKLLLELGGFSNIHGPNPSWPYVALCEELSEDQRKLAERLAASGCLPAAGHGLPASGSCRQRWLGMAPPGPLERSVSVEIKKETRELPFWRADYELALAGVFGKPFPPPLDEQLSGMDRWVALVHRAAGSYGRQLTFKTDDIEQELGALVFDDDALDMLEELADELASRFAAAHRQATALVPTLALSTLLLMPWIRAGRSIKSAWDVLVAIADRPEAREILELLPAERREAIVWGSVEHAEAHQSFGLEAAVAMFDLAPSERVAANLRARLQHPTIERAYRGREKLQEMRKRFREVVDNTSSG